MVAFGFTIGLFLYWAVIGCAVVRALRTRMPPLQEMLLAPVVGVVLTIVPLFILNRAGLPVARFGYPLAIALLVGAGALAVLAGRPRPFVDLPWRDYAPFGAVILLALFLTGRPMLEYSLDWVSFCNDDMANYCLGAVRFYHHGFFEVPQFNDLMRGSDYSLFYWFFHVPGMGRTGSELLIAWAMSLTGLSPHQVFMPLILAFHLCQVSATGALVYRSRQLKTPALVACLLLACSALASFGALYQLNSQVIGLALLAAASAALMRPYGTPAIEADAPGPVPTLGADPAPAAPAIRHKNPARWSLLIRQGLLVGLLMSGLFVLYPEVLPMIGLAWVIYVAIQLARRQANPKAVIAIVGIAASTGVVLLWRHVRVVFVFVFGQATAGSTGGDVQNVFYPFYLLPSGLADLWGFFPLTRVPPEPLGSIAIVIGLSLLVMAAAMAFWLARREQPVGMLALVMIALGLFLFSQRASFGLYKLAMFIQPFILGTIALAWLTLVRPLPAAASARSRGKLPAGERRARFRQNLRRFGPLVLLALPGLFTQQGYVQASRGRGQGTGFGELADPSASRINADFRRLLAANGVPDGMARPGAPKPPPPPGGLVLDPYNIVLSKFQGVYTRGTEAAFPSTELGTAVISFDPSRSQAPHSALVVGGDMYERLFASFPHYRFDLHDPAKPGAANPFVYRTLGPPVPTGPKSVASSAPPLFIGAGGKQSAYNRWHGLASDQNFFAAPIPRVRDYLLFIESDLGRGYYLSPRDIAMYQLEPDPKFMVGTTFSAAGRHLLFEVVNPSPKVRLLLEITTSLRADAQNALPPASAVGSTRVPFPFTGRGSGRVFSEPLEVQTIGGRSFVAVDMGQDVGPFPMYRRGLMRLYGRNVSLDWRRIVAFARDVSVVSERQYEAMNPPSQLQSFPKDLQNNQLEYSGIYEDGWASDHAWADLAAPWNASAVSIKGNVPDLGDKGFQTDMTVRVDGEEVAHRTLGLGWFELSAPMPKAAAPRAPGRRRVELAFSRYQKLPIPDGRPTTFQFGSLGFETAPTAPSEIKNFATDLGNPLLAPAGLDGDGWAAPKATLTLSQPPGRGQLVVRGMVPKLPGADDFKSTLTLRVDGKPVAEQTLGLDQFEVRADVPPTGTAAGRKVELEFSNSQKLPAPDARTVGARLASVGFEPAPVGPSRIAKIPEDLKDPRVAAGGIDDDGWVGTTASARLVQVNTDDELTVQGMVPQIGDAGTPGDGAAGGFRTEMRVLVDGQEVTRQTFGPGPMDVSVVVPPIPPGSDPHRPRQVELRFSATQQLPPPDARNVAARLSSLGFGSPAKP